MNPVWMSGDISFPVVTTQINIHRLFVGLFFTSFLFKYLNKGNLNNMVCIFVFKNVLLLVVHFSRNFQLVTIDKSSVPSKRADYAKPVFCLRKLVGEGANNCH